MSGDEKIVLEGSRIKVLSQQRPLANASESGVVVDYFRFTFNRAYIPVTRQMPNGSDPQDLARFFAFKFAELLGFVVGMDRPGRDYYEFPTTIENAFAHEVASVSAGGESQRDTIFSSTEHFVQEPSNEESGTHCAPLRKPSRRSMAAQALAALVPRMEKPETIAASSLYCAARLAEPSRTH